jgi:hypothetical protein
LTFSFLYAYKKEKMTKSQIVNDTGIIKSNVVDFSNNIGKTIGNFFTYLNSKNLDFFFKWCYIFITIGIYVTCLVLFLKVNQSVKANALNTPNNKAWYYFLFETWYFVPVLTIGFILILLIIYNSNLSLLSYVLLSLVFIFFTLSIYYSYNTLWVGYKNNPVIMYSLTLAFMILFWFSVNNKLYTALMLSPLFVMTIFGIIMGVNYSNGNLDIFVLPNPRSEGYKLKVSVS